MLAHSINLILSTLVFLDLDIKCNLNVNTVTVYFPNRVQSFQ